MPKKPRKQHVTHYMDPNPWATPMKGRKTKKKGSHKGTKTHSFKGVDTKSQPPVHKDQFYTYPLTDTYEDEHWQSHPLEVITVSNLGTWDNAYVTSPTDKYVLIFEDGTVSYQKEETAEQRAQKYLNQYPGANPVDVMVAFHNEEKRGMLSRHRKTIDHHVAKYESSCASIAVLKEQNMELRLELESLRQQAHKNHIQREHILSLVIPTTESVRHFRDE